MRFISTFIISFMLGLGVSGCSPNVERSVTKKEPVSGRTVNATPEAAANSGAPANVTVPGNDVVSPETAGNIRKRKIEPKREGESTSPSSIDIEAELKRSAKPAAENSEFGAVLTDVLFERRTFKSHPLLLRVEKLTKGQEKTIKVYLKDGRTIDLAGDKIDFISTARSADILKAAGMEMPAAARDPRSKSSQ